MTEIDRTPGRILEKGVLIKFSFQKCVVTGTRWPP
jgi:hypothetical protein